MSLIADAFQVGDDVCMVFGLLKAADGHLVIRHELLCALRYLSILSSAHWMPVDFIAAEYLVIRSSPGRTSDYAVERRPWLFFAALCDGQPRHFLEAFLPFSGSPPANGGLVVNKMTAL